ncbi:hypothetical protein [uncultured Bacteroides sp.]|uniref:hypothetical protein n=1 Tax=uncultured Bacteroides sp. TaxID=162156 RepID=UPI002AAADD48|nr:hypothetical protein [uncultured Bacteroides sp.]
MNKALVKWTFISLIIAFLFSSCNKKVQDNYLPKHTSEYLSKQLETAYKENDSVRLNAFFEEWHKSVKPNTDEFIHQNKVYTAIYDIYKVFCKFKGKPMYFVVQNQIDYTVADSEPDTIINFRPPIEKYKVVYLTKEYREALINFSLEKIYREKGEQVASMDLYNESNNRALKLDHYVYISGPGFGFAWTLESSPVLSKITFNKKLTQAIALYCGNFQGGEVTFEKVKDKWVMKSMKQKYIS